MDIGSDLFNFLITGGFLLFVFICAYSIYSIYRSNRLKHELQRVKNLSILELSIPKQVTPKQNEPPKDFRETIGVVEQFFANLANLYEGGLEKQIYGLGSLISLEIISLDGALSFFVVSPRELESVIEKQLNSFYPTAQIKRTRIPNIFKNQHGTFASGELKLAKKFILPVNTYKYLEMDPLNSLTIGAV